MCYVVDLSSEGELRKLKDYRNFSCLTMEDEIKLVLLCLALNPVELTGNLLACALQIQSYHMPILSPIPTIVKFNFPCLYLLLRHQEKL